jgi:hypothetical protein
MRTTKNCQRQVGDCVFEELVLEECLAVAMQQAGTSVPVKVLDGEEKLVAWIERRHAAISKCI